MRAVKGATFSPPPAAWLKKIKWNVFSNSKLACSGCSHQFASSSADWSSVVSAVSTSKSSLWRRPWCYKTRITGLSLGEVCWELGGHMMALCHCAMVLYLFFAGKAVSTLCVQIHFTDGATTKPFVKMTRGKCEFVQLAQKKKKNVFHPVWGVYEIRMFLFLFLSFHQLSRLQNVRQRSHFCPGVFLFLLTVLCEATKSAIFKKWHFFSWLEVTFFSATQTSERHSAHSSSPPLTEGFSELRPINGVKLKRLRGSDIFCFTELSCSFKSKW